ncbi:MAG: hypothetical protein IH945_04010 [Armatimonadetes bacterium]|nr:hypothetical protein [Armatimonadota bacterium]
MSEGFGGTLGKGVQVVGDVNFDGGLGSLKVTHHKGPDPMSFTYNAFGQIVMMQHGAVLSTFS